MCAAPLANRAPRDRACGGKTTRRVDESGENVGPGDADGAIPPNRHRSGAISASVTVRMRHVYEFSWNWLAAMAAVPLPLAFLVAIPIWRRREPILGNLTGSTVILGTALAMILRESVALDRLRAACLDSGFVSCWPTPTAFMRYAMYASIGLIEVIVLFLASLNVEKRMREQAYAPEWRR
jgi:hypothetical protein